MLWIAAALATAATAGAYAAHLDWLPAGLSATAAILFAGVGWARAVMDGKEMPRL
jgi:hypothetical protein